jgi:hypothetical protein
MKPRRVARSFDEICRDLSAPCNAIRPQAIRTTLKQETNMHKIIVATFTSLDGVMQAPDGPQENPTGGFTLGG